MVKYINQEILTSTANMDGIWGVCLHNDAGSKTAEQYVPWLMYTHDIELGIAHYYIDRNTIARVINTNKIGWHTATAVGNGHYIGYEVCQSFSASDVDFILNENMVFRQIAEDFKFYKMTANVNTVRMHKDFYSTACPHRSLALHGGVESFRAYAIGKINHYMSLGNTVDEMLANEGGQAIQQVQAINNRKQVNYNATFVAGGYSVDSKPWGEANFETWGNTTDLMYRTFCFYEEDATGSYANGIGLGWVDKRSLGKERKQAGFDVRVASGGYSVDSLPWGEEGFHQLGTTDNHVDSIVKVLMETVDSKYAYIRNDEKILGWVDNRALTKELKKPVVVAKPTPEPVKELVVVESILYLPNDGEWTIYPADGAYTAGTVISTNGETDNGTYMRILGDRGNNIVIVDMPNFGVVAIRLEEDEGAKITKKYA